MILMNCRVAQIIPLAAKVSVNAAIAINASMRVINFRYSCFDFILPLMIISLAIFQVIVVSVWTDVKSAQQPSDPKLVMVISDESISL